MSAAPTSSRPRGACPNDLAAEVYRRVNANVLKKLGRSINLRQTIPDAVGEAYMFWLASPVDKTLHNAGHHAHWLAKDAVTLLIGDDPSRRRRAQRVRSCASWSSTSPDSDTAHREEARHEAILRRFYGVSDPADYEGNLIDALDAVNSPNPCAWGPGMSWREALGVLFARGWSRAQVAVVLGASYSALRTWMTNISEPREEAQTAIHDLARSDMMPPKERITVRGLMRTPKAARPPPVPEFVMRRTPRMPRAPHMRSTAPDRLLDIVRDMLDRGDRQIDVAKRLGVSEYCVCTWRAGKHKPGVVQSAEVLARIEAVPPAAV